MSDRQWKKQVNSPYFQYVPGELIPYLDMMMLELSEHKCSYKREIGEKGGLIRVPTDFNPAWYQKLCSMHPPADAKKFKKKPRTRIKRANVLSTLKCLITYGCGNSYLIDYLLDIARELHEMDNPEIKPFDNQF